MTLPPAVAKPLAERMARGVPYRFDDAGKAGSKRPKQRNDCVVRALVLATGKPYDWVHDDLVAAGVRDYGQGCHFQDWLADNGNERYGHVFTRHRFPSVKGQRRMNPVSFSQQFPTGTWIVRTAKHVHVVKDGVHLDTFPPRPDRCIYGAWSVTAKGAK